MASEQSWKTKYQQILKEAEQQERQSKEQREMMAEQLESMQQKMAAMEASSERMQEQIRRERARAMTDLLTQLPNRESRRRQLMSRSSGSVRV